MPLPRPPSADPLVALADQCVQCGLCLPACPTYRQARIEAESPRGRIALARGWALEALAPTDAGDAHLDACLACRSCEAACPAGVRYGALLVEARRRQRVRRRPRFRQRLVEALAARPRLLATVLRAYRRAFPLLPMRLRPVPRPPVAGDAAARRASIGPLAKARTSSPSGSDAAGTGAARVDPLRTDAPPPTSVALFVGCAAREYERSTRDAVRRLFAAAGIETELPAGQTCCGGLHAHAGDTATATALARRNAAAFDGARIIVTLASGCHESISAALSPDARVVDALELLAGHAARLHLRPYAGRVGLHVPCTQHNVVRSVDAMRALLARVPGLEVVELEAGFGCCGAAGAAMLDDPARAATFRAPLLAAIDAAGVDEVLSANLGCRLHLANASRVRIRHPIEFLADRLHGADAAPQ